MYVKRGRADSGAPRLFAFLCACGAALLASPGGWGGGGAQEQPPPRQTPPAAHREEGAPPPMKHLPGDVRAQLSAARDNKERTKLAIVLAEARIAQASAHTGAERYTAAATELGVYEAIIRDTISHLQGSGKITNKTRDHFKRLELALRSHMPRIETIRRTTPAYYAANVKDALDFVRGARTEALNAFYDQTVLRESPPLKEGTGGGAGERATGTTPAAAPEKERKP